MRETTDHHRARCSAVPRGSRLAWGDGVGLEGGNRAWNQLQGRGCHVTSDEAARSATAIDGLPSPAASLRWGCRASQHGTPTQVLDAIHPGRVEVEDRNGAVPCPLVSPAVVGLGMGGWPHCEGGANHLTDVLSIKGGQRAS